MKNHVGPIQDIEEDGFININSLNLDLGCQPEQLISAVEKLDEGDRTEVRRLGFGAFLELKVANISQRQATHWFVTRLMFEEQRISVHIRQDLILYITPETINLILDLPHGNVAPLSYIAQKESARLELLRTQLDLANWKVDIVLEFMRNCKDRNVKIKCFFLC